MDETPKPDAEPPLDCEDWQIVFKVYSEHPLLAFVLAQHLIGLKEMIEGGPEQTAQSTAAIDRAVDVLYRHTHFQAACHKFYRLAVEGKLTIEQEKLLNELGVKL